MRHRAAVAGFALLLGARAAVCEQPRALAAGTFTSIYEGPTRSSPPMGALKRSDPAFVGCRVPGPEPWVFLGAYSGYVTGYAAEADLKFLAPASGPRTAAADVGPHTSPTLAATGLRYVGDAKCVACHRHEDRIHQHAAHHTALAGLVGPKAELAGQSRGVARPDQEPRCVKCHQTAYGATPDQLTAGFDGPGQSVGCEACHGPGDGWWEPAIHAVDYKRALSLGMTDISTLEQQDRLCRSCHNELSPTYKRFDLQTFGETIRHWPRRDDDEWRRFFAAQVAGQASGADLVLSAPPPGIPECTAALVADLRAKWKSGVTPGTPPPVAPPPVIAPPVASGGTPAAPPPVATTAAAPAPAAGGAPRPQEPAEKIVLGASLTPPAHQKPTAFLHRAHAHERKSAGGSAPIGCNDIHCHHTVPMAAGGKLPESYNCHKCHAYTGSKVFGTGVKDKADSNKAFHTSCFGCHKAVGGKAPVKCDACHGKV